jgi:hypothetical protein
MCVFLDYDFYNNLQFLLQFIYLFVWAKRPTATPVNVGKRTDTELRGKSLTISVLKYYVFS